MGSNSEKLIPKLIKPFIKKQIYICGEQYSSHQAWVEGSLETADMVLDKLKLQNSKHKKTTTTRTRIRTKKHTV